MKSSNRFLLWFGITIGLLVIVTVVLVLTVGSKPAELLPADTPEGVVQRFLQAVQDNDYQKAYTYLHVVEKGVVMTYASWATWISPSPRSDRQAWKATLGDTLLTGSTATVDVIVETFQPGGPFEDPVNSHQVRFNLGKIDGTWYITTRPPMYYFMY